MTQTDLIKDWLAEAGQIALGYFREGTAWSVKVDNTVFSEADRAIEDFLVATIRSAYRDHGIMAEEGSSIRGTEYTWAIDPIDGTQAFLWGVPTWCISVGLLRNSVPCLGVIYFPVTGEWYALDEHKQAVWNQRRIEVCKEMDSRSLLCVSPRMLSRYTVSFPGYTCSFASGILHNCLVARGVAAAAITLRPSIWDLAGVYPILRAAGAEMRYLSGEAVDFAQLAEHPAHQPIIAGSPSILDHVLKCLTPLQGPREL